MRTREFQKIAKGCPAVDDPNTNPNSFYCNLTEMWCEHGACPFEGKRLELTRKAIEYWEKVGKQ
jgi:hypothetical protein